MEALLEFSPSHSLSFCFSLTWLASLYCEPQKHRELKAQKEIKEHHKCLITLMVKVIIYSHANFCDSATWIPHFWCHLNDMPKRVIHA